VVCRCDLGFFGWPFPSSVHQYHFTSPKPNPHLNQPNHDPVYLKNVILKFLEATMAGKVRTISNLLLRECGV